MGEAVEQLQRLCEAQPGYPDGHAMLGNLLVEQRRFADAKRVFRAAASTTELPVAARRYFQAQANARCPMSDSSMSSNAIRVFYGKATDTLADVYLEIGDSLAHRPDFRAEIRGPECSLARTLPHTVPFLPFDPPRLWRAQVIDPCFWSPEQPMRYGVRVEPGNGDAPILVPDFGIRHFGSDRGQLWLNGRRWVLRAAHWPDTLRDPDLAAWQEGCLAMVVRDPTAEFCQRASQAGVMLVVWVDADGAVEQLGPLTRWAAVAVALLDGPLRHDPALLRRAAPNLLFGYPLTDARCGSMIRAPDLVVCRADESLLLAAQRLQPARSICGWRPAGRLRSVPEARAACDRLQRDLAPRFDLNGYLV